MKKDWNQKETHFESKQMTTKTNANRFTKPIRVAGNEEFGEKYHVAIALLRAPELKAYVLGRDIHHAKSFLTVLASGRVDHFEDHTFREDDLRPTRESTDIYCYEKWSADEVQRWREKILKASSSKSAEINDFLAKNLGPPGGDSALIWIRNTEYKPERNSTGRSVTKLIEVVREQGLRPVLVGDPVGEYVEGFGNLIAFFRNKIFDCEESICSQLLMFDALRQNYGVRVSIGMKSGGMDGPGLFLGLPTISFSHCFGDSRVERIAQHIDNFEVVPLDARGPFRQHTPEELARLRRALQRFFR
jgi:hypothetical protein